MSCKTKEHKFHKKSSCENGLNFMRRFTYMLNEQKFHCCTTQFTMLVFLPSPAGGEPGTGRPAAGGGAVVH